MGRRKGDTPQKAALRQLMQGYLKDNDISVKMEQILMQSCVI